MNSIAIALKHMLAAGMPHDAIVAAVAEMEAEVTPQRSKGADRQARYRERNKASQNVTRDAPLSLPPNEKISNPPTHTPENITPARKGDRAKPHGPAKPEGVSDQTWADFVHHRKVKRAPVSETAMAGIRREAAIAGWSLEGALAETVARGWQSFKAEFVAPKTGGSAGAAPGSFLAHLSGASP